MLDRFWSVEEDELLEKLQTSKDGLSSKAVEERLEKYGSNQLSQRNEESALKIFLNQFNNPIMFILLAATIISFFTNDITDGIIILIIIFISAIMSFFQEYKAKNDVSKLLNVVSIDTKVLRDNSLLDVAVKDIVIGDIISLAAGDIIPADCRIISSNNLSVDESMLTGETFPIEKEVTVIKAETELSDRINCLWMGTHIISGSCQGVVVNNAKDSELGKITKSLLKKEAPTNFEVGVRDFGMLILKITALMIGIIFLFNIILQKPFFESFMFALALAVGLTPQMLPAIISVNLSNGANDMAKKQVIVKKLSSIENFGSMNVLCSDKTGTITEGKVKLIGSLGVDEKESDKVRLISYINSKLQTGYTNPIDEAILLGGDVDFKDFIKLDEIPYSFLTKTLSIVCKSPEQSVFKGREITVKKGALSNILSTCSFVEVGGNIVPLDSYEGKINESFEKFSNEGYRVLGVSYIEDEKEIFIGYLLFLDPIKEGLPDTVKELKSLGIDLKIITGDNALIAKHIAKQLDLNSEDILTGSDVARLSLHQLALRARDVSVFAEIDPNQKESIILALKSAGNVVGYMGDGINDSPAIHAADVGISVNSAADTAKDAASIVLLEQDLSVLIEGVKEGRRTFANTLKYIFIATSANLGNMVSMAGASLFLKFLPLLPKQILFTNLLTDVPSLQIASDNVDQQWLDKPIKWDMNFIKKFIFTFGLISSIFDYLTFFILEYVHGAGEVLFHTGWFVESIMSASIAMLVIRTVNPVFKSNIKKKLLLSVIVVNIFVVALPYTPLAKYIGLEPFPLSILLSLVVIVILYLLSLEAVKKIFYKKNRI